MKRWLRILAVLLLAAGVSLLGLTVYRVADPGAAHRQKVLQGELQRTWRAHPSPSARSGLPPAPLKQGQPFALLTIPRLGHWAVVEGTGEAQLALGPGHVTGTSWPGGANFAVAAHVITAGNPFMHLSGLRPGDLVYVRMGDRTFTYRVTHRPVRVDEHDVGVLRGVPGGHQVTLITCWPLTLNATPWRTIVTGDLISVS